MPVEIRELVIRATAQRSEGIGDEGDCEPASTQSSVGSPSAGSGAVVQSCVREVLKILARKKER